MEKMAVAIVGGGIMGLSLAWALSRDGHYVRVLEQGRLPNVLAASYDEHRLIRRAYGSQRGYLDMVGHAHAAWDMLWRDLGRRLHAETGTLVLSSAAEGWALDTAASLADAGIPYEELDRAALEARFPTVQADRIAFALHLRDGGVLLANRIVATLVDHLRNEGVAIDEQMQVSEVDPDSGRIIVEDGPPVDADVVVVAVGAWLPKLMPDYAGRVTPSRQVVAYVDTPDDQAEMWARHPMVLEIDDAIGFYLVPPVSHSRVKIGVHTFSMEGDPEEHRGTEDYELQDMLSRMQHRLNTTGLKIDSGRACLYTVAENERFIVEPAGSRCWVMTGFSGHGFKFAPLLGLELMRVLSDDGDAAAFSRWAAGQGGDWVPSVA